MSVIAKPTQFLTFNLASETYALPILQVREVLEYRDIPRIPNVPAAMVGVLRLRGEVVPVMDLRTRIGLPPVERTVATCIIIVEIRDTDGRTSPRGLVADSVREVLALDPSQVEPPPKTNTSSGDRFILGLGKSGSQFVILLDVGKVMDQCGGGAPGTSAGGGLALDMGNDMNEGVTLVM
ncbi:MAG: chemotaxis protein CheW [Magnetococcales bacterium]|nr:chemotaxis protein CheW [Magnetococcales bacterium]